uniref:Uncharacterized protein n=1 Tax=Octopus bimaculoides TaxID=37653 RepID=A0A0L8GYX8_OCTBM
MREVLLPLNTTLCHFLLHRTTKEETAGKKKKQHLPLCFNIFLFRKFFEFGCNSVCILVSDLVILCVLGMCYGLLWCSYFHCIESVLRKMCAVLSSAIFCMLYTLVSSGVFLI